MANDVPDTASRIGGQKRAFYGKCLPAWRLCYRPSDEKRNSAVLRRFIWPRPVAATLVKTLAVGEGVARRFRIVDTSIPLWLDLDSECCHSRSVKTTVDIPEHELRDAMRFTKAKTKREAVVKVLEDFNRRRRMAELVKYAGTFSDAYPTNDEIEAVDEHRDRRLGARSRR